MFAQFELNRKQSTQIHSYSLHNPHRHFADVKSTRMNSQLDCLRSQLKQAQQNLLILKDDHKLLRHSLDDKLIFLKDIQVEHIQLIQDQNSIVRQAERLKIQDENLQKQMAKLIQEREKLKLCFSAVQIDKDQLINQIQNKTRVSQSLSSKLLYLQSIQLQLRAVLEERNQDIVYFQRDISLRQQQKKDLIAHRAQKEKKISDLISQISTSKKGLQDEKRQQREGGKRARMAENILRTSQQFVSQSKRKIFKIQIEADEILQNNIKLKRDKQNCEQHIKNLERSNKQLISQLKGFEANDSEVRELIAARQDKIRKAIKKSVD